jgi:hypothetical protein
MLSECRDLALNQVDMMFHLFVCRDMALLWIRLLKVWGFPKAARHD